MPIVSPEYAKYMTEIAQENLVRSFRKGSWIEPFHALYSRELTEDIERSVKRGIYKIFDVLKYKNVIRISENKVREYSPDLGVFTT